MTKRVARCILAFIACCLFVDATELKDTAYIKNSLLLEYESSMQGNTRELEARKAYGLQFNECGNYVKVFKCMTTCRSHGYKIYRIRRDCKCFCHDEKISHVLPFVRQFTQGTTRKVPKTEGPKLWQVYVSLSHKPQETTMQVTTEHPITPYYPAAETPTPAARGDVETTQAVTTIEAEGESTGSPTPITEDPAGSPTPTTEVPAASLTPTTEDPTGSPTPTTEDLTTLLTPSTEDPDGSSAPTTEVAE